MNFLRHNCTVVHHETALSLGVLCKEKLPGLTSFQPEEKLAEKYLVSQCAVLLKL